MLKASLVVTPPYTRDRVFLRDGNPLNRDNCLAFFFELQSALSSRGIEVHTADLTPMKNADVVIFCDTPSVRAQRNVDSRTLNRSMLLLFEPELIKPDNWNSDFINRCGQVWTWCDSLIDGLRFHKFAYSFIRPSQPARGFANRKMCTLISGNKHVKHPLELYSARRNAIEWFEKNCPQKFEYYGVGWDRPYLRGGLFTRALRRLNLLQFLPKAPTHCFRGLVSHKVETLSQYKFAICFENSRDIEGYVTEKLFDALFAGCVPIYWGAPNIENLLPRECYVDFRMFLKSADPFREMLNYLEAYSEKQHQEAIKAFDDFWCSSNSKIFHAELLAAEIANSAFNIASQRASH